MFANASGVMINGGTFISQTNRTSRGMDILIGWIATDALHNSKELYDAPKCHPHTRIAILEDIMKWAGESECRQNDFMLWLFGPAGAGKSAIAKRIAEIAADNGMLIATFFFSRTSPTRRTGDRLVATLAYQLAVSIPDTRSHIEDAIDRDPIIFNKDILTQIDTVLIKPLLSILSTRIFSSKKLIVIDGLDECSDNQAQETILECISQSFAQYELPIKVLVVSRPEPNLVTSFNCNEPLKSIHRRLALDDAYRPDDDIHLFLSDKFEQIRLNHPLRSTIPTFWPSQKMLRTLVEKASGQFIYASTMVKFVESKSHRPSARLNIILGISPPGRTNPFAELDALYTHLLSSVDDIRITLRVLSLYVMTPRLGSGLRDFMSPELFLSLEPGDIPLALMNLSSILTYHESSGEVEILHASLVDFLSDKHRSTIFYIDKASTCTVFVRQILQYVKGPDGIQAGDIVFFYGVIELSPWIHKGQLRSDILNFDLDAFINASIRWRYKEHAFQVPGSTVEAFDILKRFLNVALEDRDKKRALDRLNKSFESRLRVYQSHWRLQLLLTLAVADVMYYARHEVPYCRCMDILLEMNDHHLHLVDQDALDLRHKYVTSGPRMIDMITSRPDGDAYASAALHCMRFLSNPPKYSERNESPEMMGVIYAEWKATCGMTLDVLCILLPQANTSPELVQFVSKHDIHPAIQKGFSTDRVVSEVNVHIIAFLSRARVRVNWRIMQQSLLTNDQPPSKLEEGNERSDEQEDLEATRILRRQRLDQCCFHAHY